MSTKNVLTEIEKMFDRKQNEYGDVDPKVVEMLKHLYPNGTAQKDYFALVTTAKILEKLARISNAEITHEGRQDCWVDIVGYGMLASANAASEDDGNSEG